MMARSLGGAFCATAGASMRGAGRVGRFESQDSSIEKTSPELRITDRSITFCNSRILPGQS